MEESFENTLKKNIPTMRKEAGLQEGDLDQELMELESQMINHLARGQSEGYTNNPALFYKSLEPITAFMVLKREPNARYAYANRIVLYMQAFIKYAYLMSQLAIMIGECHKYH
jgi:hypothetical protein